MAASTDAFLASSSCCTARACSSNFSSFTSTFNFSVASPIALFDPFSLNNASGKGGCDRYASFRSLALILNSLSNSRRKILKVLWLHSFGTSLPSSLPPRLFLLLFDPFFLLDFRPISLSCLIKVLPCRIFGYTWPTSSSELEFEALSICIGSLTIASSMTGTSSILTVCTDNPLPINI